MIDSSFRAAGLTACLVLALPLAARADRGDCDFDPSTSMRVCSSPVSCMTRATCISGPGTDDATCQSVMGAATGTRECLPDCSTLFSCTSSSSCPVLNGMGGVCAPTLTAPQICTWPSSGSVPLRAQITYCVPIGNHISEAVIDACHHVPGSSPAQFTPDYFRGDCDDDGCPNGYDNDPCSAAPTVAACTPTGGTPSESPFCAPLPALACDITDTGFDCGDARPCNPASGSLLPCPVGTCEVGWSDVPRCRPPCSTLFLCTTGTAPGGGAPAEQCPTRGGATGVCNPLPGSIAPVEGRDGVCIYSDFFDTSCVGGTALDACFVDPAGNLTSNYFAGDCDQDGAPNACDTMICGDGGQTSSCRSVLGMGCTPSYTPPVDAGVDAASDVDAASTNGDAGGNGDSGNAGVDASSNGDSGASDSGNVGGDASVGIDGGIAAGFSGGGGCRCVAAGTSTRPWAGTALLLLGLGLLMRRRATR